MFRYRLLLRTSSLTPIVVPAKAGTQYTQTDIIARNDTDYWMPAYAGMTAKCKSGFTHQPILRTCNSQIQILPIWVEFFNQPDFPGAIPFLKLLFPDDRTFNLAKFFEIDEMGNAVSPSKSICQLAPMLIRTPAQIVCNTDVKRATDTAR